MIGGQRHCCGRHHEKNIGVLSSDRRRLSGARWQTPDLTGVRHGSDRQIPPILYRDRHGTIHATQWREQSPCPSYHNGKSDATSREATVCQHRFCSILALATISNYATATSPSVIAISSANLISTSVQKSSPARLSHMSAQLVAPLVHISI